MKEIAFRHKDIEEQVIKAYPDTQAIYLFGSSAKGMVHKDSDVDIGLLLPHEKAKQEKHLMMGALRFSLEKMLRCHVDMVNLRLVSTVMQKEVISGIRIYCGDIFAADEFEMLTLSFYQRLNQERQKILSAFYTTKRAYPV